MLGLLNWFLIGLSYCISPFGDSAISSSSWNQGDWADYTFSLTLQSKAVIGSKIVVTYPKEFQENLGVPLTTDCDPVCSVSDREISFEILADIEASSPVKLAVSGIKNPASSGGTGSFEVRVEKGRNIIEENRQFGTVGIGPGAVALTSTKIVLAGGTIAQADGKAQVILTTKTGASLSEPFFVRFGFVESGFGLVSDQKKITLTADGSSIVANLNFENGFFFSDPIELSLVSGLVVEFSFQVSSPAYAISTSLSIFGLFRKDTSLFLQAAREVPFPSIATRPFSTLSIQPVYASSKLANLKETKLKILASLHRSLGPNATLRVKLPQEFSFSKSNRPDGQPSVVSGNEFIQKPTFSFDEDTNSLIFMNCTIPSSSFTITFWSTLPASSGTTKPIVLSTFNEQGKAVHRSEVSLSLLSVSVFSSFTASLVNDLIGPASFDLSLTMVPSISIPTTFSFGLVEIASILTSIPSCTVEFSDPASGIFSNVLPITGNKFSLSNPVSPLSEVELLFRGCYHPPSQAIEIPFSLDASDNLNVLALSASFGVTFRAPVFTSLTATFDSPFAEFPALLAVEFSTNIAFDSEIGYFELAVISISSASVSSDLEYSSAEIPCRAVTGLDIETSCSLSSSSSDPAVRVENFGVIASGTTCRFDVDSFSVLSGAFRLVLTYFEKGSNGLTTSVRQSTVSISPGAKPSPTIVYLSPDDTSHYTISTLLIGSTFDINCNLPLSSTIPAGSDMILRLPANFVPELSSGVTVSVNQEALGVVCFPGKAGGSIHFQLTQALASGGPFSLDIRGLVWPKASSSYGRITLDVLGVSGAVTQQFFMPSLPSPAPSEFKSLKYSISNPSRGAVGTRIDIFFSLDLDVSDSVFTITLPLDFSLLAVTPAISVYLEGGIVSANVSPNAVSFPPFDCIANRVYNASLAGITAPEDSVVFTGWQASVTQNGALVVQNTDAFAFSLDPEIQVAPLAFEFVRLEPSNAGLEAEVAVSFRPRSTLPPGASIKLIFPAGFPALPFEPDCLISGGLTAFLSCTAEGQVVNLVTDATLKPTDDSIELRIGGFSNPLEMSATSRFELETAFDGITQDSTSVSSFPPLPISLSKIPGNVTFSLFSINPRNEAEPATYMFEFTPSTPLYDKMELVFVFPKNFDADFSAARLASFSSNVGIAPTLISSGRILVVRGLSAYSLESNVPLKISFSNIKNPKRSLTSLTRINVGSRVIGQLNFIDHDSAFCVVSLTDPPTWLRVQSLSFASNYALDTTGVSLVFESFQGIPPIEQAGSLLISFPSDFRLPEGTSFGCSLTGPNGEVPPSTCVVQSNALNVTWPSYTAKGLHSLKIVDFPTAILAGVTGLVRIQAFNSDDQAFSESSFANIDPLKFNFILRGLELTVNNKQIVTLYPGTQTAPIKISTVFPCLLSISLQLTLPQGLSASPASTTLSAYTTSSTFMISALANFPPGTYSLDFTKSGDAYPPFYSLPAPLIIFVPLPTVISVFCESINDVPLGGNSLSNRIWVDLAPEAQLEVVISFRVALAGLSSDQRSVIFSPGVTEGFFTISHEEGSSSDSSSTEIELRLRGISASLYALSVTSLPIKLAMPDLTLPQITLLKTISTGKFTASFSVSCSEIADIYYYSALFGTPLLSATSLLNNDAPKTLSSRLTYGTIRMRSQLTATIELSGLSEGTSYTLCAMPIDRGYNINPELLCVNFKTLAKFPFTLLRLQLNTPEITPSQIFKTRSLISFFLARPVKYVTILDLSTNLSPSSLTKEPKKFESPILDNIESQFLSPGKKVSPILQSLSVPNIDYTPYNSGVPASTSTNFDLLIAPLTGNPDALSPSAAIANVNFTAVFAALPWLNPVVSTLSLITNQITFSQPPSIVGTTVSSISVSAAIDFSGYVLTVAIPYSKKTGNIPSSFQISLGLDSDNSEQMNIKKQVKANEIGVFEYTGLDSGTLYVICLVPAGGTEAVLDLMDSQNIVVLQATTEPAPDEEEGNGIGIHSLFAAALLLLILL